MSEPPPLADIARTRISDGQFDLDCSALRSGSFLGEDGARLAGRSILLATKSQLLAAAAMVELDGLVARLTVAPPDLKPEQVDAVLADAAVDCVVTDTHSFDMPSFAGTQTEVVGIAKDVHSLAAPFERIQQYPSWSQKKSCVMGRLLFRAPYK